MYSALGTASTRALNVTRTQSPHLSSPSGDQGSLPGNGEGFCPLSRALTALMGFVVTTAGGGGEDAVGIKHKDKANRLW